MRGPARAVVVAAVAIAAAAAFALGGALNGSAIRFTDRTPHDLRAIATGAWDRFLRAFPARSGCLGDVTVAVAWDLADRARYEPGLRLVLVRAPGTAANLQATLLHEFAHHVEHRCQIDAGMRRRFVRAAGLPPNTPWRAGDRWDRTPSERFAEAAVRVVLGRPPPHVLIHVRPEEVQAVAAWAAGG